MEAVDILKFAGQYGVAGILALVLGWVIYKVGMRMIAAQDRAAERTEAAIDRQTARIDAHTAADVQALTALTLRIEKMEATVGTKLEGFVDRVEDWLDRTPVSGPVPANVRRERSQPIGSQPLPTSREASGEYYVPSPRAHSEPGGTKKRGG